MFFKQIRGIGAFVLGSIVLSAPAFATFHLMQIEQVIGGVNGDVTAQAIQLRLRASGQNQVSQGKLVVRNAAGASPVTIVDMTTNVNNSQSGRRVLIASANFLSMTNPVTVPDFMMTNLIPASYLNAGSLTFESDAGTIYWRLSWGGTGYTGTGMGNNANDSDSNFNPPFGSALPSTTAQALQFTGMAAALSTNNAAQYAVTAGAAVFTNNANATFSVSTPPVGACCVMTGNCAIITQAACTGTYRGDGTNCDPPFCSGMNVSITGSDPPNNAIDARQPTSLAGGCVSHEGWNALDLYFDGDASALTAADFGVTSVPPGAAPTITQVMTGAEVDELELTLSGPIAVGRWTVITHTHSGTSTRLGYLPGDVNGDQTASPVDILRLIDHLNGVENYEPYQTDIDRSGATNPADILRVIDLLNGADCFDTFNGMTLPP